eukprot:GHVS01060764.1.p1 GENE.GHVS01060764.1~~GHVS01060764.1.p1  ORF type:complete len:384 (+),score=80.26 GHVS01060764.1:36-1187(+)
MKRRGRGGGTGEAASATRKRGTGGRGGGRVSRPLRTSGFLSDGSKHQTSSSAQHTSSVSSSGFVEHQLTMDQQREDWAKRYSFGSSSEQEETFRLSQQKNLQHCQYVQDQQQSKHDSGGVENNGQTNMRRQPNRASGTLSSPSSPSFTSLPSSSLAKGNASLVSSGSRDGLVPSDAVSKRRKISPPHYHIPPYLRLTPPHKRTPTFHPLSPSSSSASSGSSSASSSSPRSRRPPSSSPHRLSQLLPPNLFSNFRALSDCWQAFLTGATHSYYTQPRTGHTLVVAPGNRPRLPSAADEKAGNCWHGAGRDGEVEETDEGRDGRQQGGGEAGRASGGGGVIETQVGKEQGEQCHEDSGVSVVGNTVLGRNAVYRYGTTCSTRTHG